MKILRVENDFSSKIILEGHIIEVCLTDLDEANQTLDISFVKQGGDFNELLNFKNPIIAMRTIFNQIDKMIKYCSNIKNYTYTFEGIGTRGSIYKRYLKKLGYNITYISYETYQIQKES